MKAKLMLAAVMLMCAGPVSPQAPSPARFEVASIKLHDPNTRATHAGIVLTGTRLTGDLVTVNRLIEYAYDLDDSPGGGPGWADSEIYDVQAKAPGETPISTDQARQMMQSLLADRFHLEFHHGSKQIVAYTLVIAKGGPKLQPSGPTETFSLNVKMLGGYGEQLTGVHCDLAHLAERISISLGAVPVTDNTGLDGAYDFVATWLMWHRDTNPATLAATDPNIADVLTALKEQMGLTLVAGKATEQTLIVDRVERPTAN